MLGSCGQRVGDPMCDVLHTGCVDVVNGNASGNTVWLALATQRRLCPQSRQGYGVSYQLQQQAVCFPCLWHSEATGGKQALAEPEWIVCRVPWALI
jgi:hypothetical protein